MMMNKPNNILKSTPYAIFKLLAYFISMVSLPILTNLFTKSDFGIISALEAKISLFVSLFLVGIPQSYIRFYNKYKKINLLDKFNFNVLIFLVIIFVFSFSICFSVLYLSSSETESIVIILPLIVAFSVLTQQLSTVIRAKEMTFLHATILGINDILGYVLPICLIQLLGLTVNNYFISKLIVPLLIVIIVLLFIKKEFHLSSFDSSIMKEIIQYGAPLILVSIGGTIFSSGDRILIEYLLGSESVAIYSVSSKIAHAIQQVVIFPISMVIFPMYIRIWEEEGRENTERVLSKWLNVYCFIAIAIIAGSIVIRNELILLLSNNTYVDGAVLIPILVTGLLLYGCYYFISAGFFVDNKTKQLGLIILFCSIFNIFLSYLMGKLGGVTGIAIATSITYIIFLMVSYMLGKKIITVRISCLQILRFIISAVIMVIVLNFLPVYASLIYNLVLKILVGILLYTSLNLKFILKVNEKN